MSFDRSREVVAALYELASSSSTNSELAARADREGLPHLTVMLTRYQSAGRGRLGRSWTAPPGASLASSVLLRPLLPDGTTPTPDRLGWIPVIAGVSMAEAVAGVLPGRGVGFKWPNDVLVDGRKLCGVLAELLPQSTGVVIGAGLNTRMSVEELPVPTATSLAIEGVAVDDAVEDLVLAAYLEGVRDRVARYLAAGGDAEASGIRAQARARCLTLGRAVRIELPDGAELVGTAVDLDADGRLIVADRDGLARSVAAGDVTHVR
ncbi:biotin--[acetyl-CoA-carboxylase] ligase [Protaetiibacter intestinalis]|uniref:biotin--[biotin carboxyl-carrier protein] ligase n=1 Tax=Protaetiibacter intestinalis TaxID=2419774 RepID=A0A387B409_9MICO|nr:biotin--[acetyl-CoA-carboxylase] ligase [Protaetiibacter intestinalis]AYF98322.1 biotin--[acetyl-CoA-carboxylase] ligase [Protaetiibacter intestinalis]